MLPKQTGTINPNINFHGVPFVISLTIILSPVSYLLDYYLSYHIALIYKTDISVSMQKSRNPSSQCEEGFPLLKLVMAII